MGRRGAKNYGENTGMDRGQVVRDGSLVVKGITIVFSDCGILGSVRDLSVTLQTDSFWREVGALGTTYS